MQNLNLINLKRIINKNNAHRFEKFSFFYAQICTIVEFPQNSASNEKISNGNTTKPEKFVKKIT